jgi:hypothetical protein
MSASPLVICSAGLLVTLRSQGYFRQQRFNAQQAFIAVERDVKGLSAQALVVGVEKGNNRPRLTQIVPCTSKHIVLPSQLLW